MPCYGHVLGQVRAVVQDSAGGSGPSSTCSTEEGGGTTVKGPTGSGSVLSGGTALSEGGGAASRGGPAGDGEAGSAPSCSSAHSPGSWTCGSSRAGIAEATGGA